MAGYNRDGSSQQMKRMTAADKKNNSNSPKEGQQQTKE